MASHGFWSLGGDNAGANAGSQSPSTREWLFSLCVHSSIVSEQNRPAAALGFRNFTQIFVLCVSNLNLKPDFLSPPPARAWCQAAAQKFSGGLGSKLCGTSLRGLSGKIVSVVVTLTCVTGAADLIPAALLNVGDAEKAADPAAKLAPPGEAAGTCGCNKSCNCTKAAVVFSDLYSTGTPAPRRCFHAQINGRPRIPQIIALLRTTEFSKEAPRNGIKNIKTLIRCIPGRRFASLINVLTRLFLSFLNYSYY